MIAKLTTIFEKQFLAWMKGEGLRYLSELTPEQLIEWRSTWKDQALAASKKYQRVVDFFYFCMRMKWRLFGRTSRKAGHRGLPIESGNYTRVYCGNASTQKEPWMRGRSIFSWLAALSVSSIVSAAPSTAPPSARITSSPIRVTLRNPCSEPHYLRLTSMDKDIRSKRESYSHRQ